MSILKFSSILIGVSFIGSVWASSVDYTQKCNSFLSQQNQVVAMNGCWQAMSAQFAANVSGISQSGDQKNNYIKTNLPIASYLVVNFSKSSAPIQFGVSSMGFCEPTQNINIVTGLGSYKPILSTSIGDLFDKSGNFALPSPPNLQPVLTYKAGATRAYDTITVGAPAVCLNIPAGVTDNNCAFYTSLGTVTYYRDQLDAQSTPIVLNYIQNNNSDPKNCPFDSSIFPSQSGH